MNEQDTGFGTTATRHIDLDRCTAVILGGHPLWLDALAAVLESQGVSVRATATHPEVALDAIVRHEAQVLILDLDTAHSRDEGFETIRKTLSTCPSVRVICVSADQEKSEIQAAFNAGAIAYVLRSVAIDDFAMAIRYACNQTVFLAAGRAASDSQPGASTIDRSEARLTKREAEVLSIVSEGKTNAEVGALLWLTEQTIKFHLSNVYRKLGVANRTEAARWAQLHQAQPSIAGAE